MKREYITSCRDRRSGNDWVCIPVMARSLDEAFHRARFAIIDKLRVAEGAIIDVKCQAEGFSAVYTHQGHAEAQLRNAWLGAETPIVTPHPSMTAAEARAWRLHEIGGQWLDDRRPDVVSDGFLVDPGTLVPDWKEFIEWCNEMEVSQDELNRFDSRSRALQEKFLTERDQEADIEAEHPGFG